MLPLIASLTTVNGHDRGYSLTNTYHHYTRVSYYSNKLAIKWNGIRFTGGETLTEYE